MTTYDVEMNFFHERMKVWLGVKEMYTKNGWCLIQINPEIEVHIPISRIKEVRVTAHHTPEPLPTQWRMAHFWDEWFG